MFAKGIGFIKEMLSESSLEGERFWMEIWTAEEVSVSGQAKKGRVLSSVKCSRRK